MLTQIDLALRSYSIERQGWVSASARLLWAARLVAAAARRKAIVLVLGMSHRSRHQCTVSRSSRPLKKKCGRAYANPAMQAAKFEFVLNLKTAKALGIDGPRLPRHVLCNGLPDIEVSEDCGHHCALRPRALINCSMF